MGLSFTHLLSRMGATEVIAVDPLRYRLEKAWEQGASRILDPLHEDVAGAIDELTDGQGADVVVEAAGTAETVNQAADLVRRHGTIIFFGLPEEDVFPFEFMKLARKQPTVIPTVSASSNDPTQAIKQAVSMVARGRLDVSWLISHRLPFEEARLAYEMYEGYQDNVVKVVLNLPS